MYQVFPALRLNGVVGSSFAFRLLGLASTFVLGVLLARLLNPAGYGRYGLVISVSALLASVAMLGTLQYAVRLLSVEKAKGNANLPKLVWGLVTLVLGTSILVISISAPIAIYLDRDGTILYLIVPASLLMTSSALIGLLSAQLRGLGSLGMGQAIEVAAKPLLALSLVVAIVMAGGTVNVSNALFIQVGVTLACVIFLAFALVRLTPFTISTWSSLPKKWWQATLPLCGIDFLRQLDGSYGLFVVAILASDVETGIYRVALSCAALLALPSTVFHIVFAPRFAEKLANGSAMELRRTARTVSRVLSLIHLAAVIGIALLGEPLLRFVFGAAYAGAGHILLMLAIGYLLFVLFGMGPIVLAMGGEEAKLLQIYGIAVGLGVAVALASIPIWGAAGAALGQITSMSLIGFLSHRIAQRRWGLSLLLIGGTDDIPS